MSGKGLSRKEREYRQHRSEIVDAALALFSQQGFHRVTMQQIAQRAEFSVGKLYKFFSNKAELYHALLEETARAFEIRLSAALASGSNELETVRACLEARIEVWSENIGAIRLYLAETQGARIGPRTHLEVTFKEQYEASLQRVAEVFRRGIEKGFFRKGDPYLYTLALDGISQNLLLAWMDRPGEIRVDVDAVLDIFFKGICIKGE